MNYSRRNAGVVAHNGMLFVIGGDDGTSNLASVEVRESNNWIGRGIEEDRAASKSPH